MLLLRWCVFCLAVLDGTATCAQVVGRPLYLLDDPLASHTMDVLLPTFKKVWLATLPFSGGPVYLWSTLHPGIAA